MASVIIWYYYKMAKTDPNLEPRLAIGKIQVEDKAGFETSMPSHVTPFHVEEVK
jgi:hypothetical protein